MAGAASARYTSSGGGGKKAGRVPLQFAEYGVDRVGHPQSAKPIQQRSVSCGEQSGLTDTGCVGDPKGSIRGLPVQQRRSHQDCSQPEWSSEVGVALGDAKHSGPQGHRRPEPVDDAAGRQTPQRYGPTSSVWSDVDWLPCLDHKTRPIESGLSPLVDVLPRGVVPSGDPSDPRYANATSEGRVMRLRGYGNAIVPEVAAVFIRSYIEARA